MTTLLILVLIVLIALLGHVIRLSHDVRAIREELLPDIRAVLLRTASLRSQSVRPMRLRHGDPFPNPHGFLSQAVAGCFLVWEWREEKWEPCELPGDMEPGPPPPFPGAFPGDVAKTWVVPVQQ